MIFWVDFDGVKERHALTELKSSNSHSDSCEHIINSWLSSVHLLVRIGILQTRTFERERDNGFVSMGLLLVVSVVYIRLLTIACSTQKVACCFLYVV
jgi:hypothetical protein